MAAWMNSGPDFLARLGAFHCRTCTTAAAIELSEPMVSNYNHDSFLETENGSIQDRPLLNITPINLDGDDTLDVSGSAILTSTAYEEIVLSETPTSFPVPFAPPPSPASFSLMSGVWPLPPSPF